MTKKKIRPNPEPGPTPDPTPEIRRLPIRVPPAFGGSMDARQFRDLAAGLKALEDAGFIRVPSTAPAPVIHAPSTFRGIEGAVDELEKYIDGFARAQALAVRLNPGGGLMGAIKEIADTKMGEQIGTVVGELASGLVKSKVREGELTKELQIEVMKLERAKIEHGGGVAAPAPMHNTAATGPIHNPTPSGPGPPAGELRISPAALEVMNAHAAKMDAASERMERLEAAVEKVLKMQAPGAPPSPRPGSTPKKKGPGRPRKEEKPEPAKVEPEKKEAPKDGAVPANPAEES